MKEAEAWLIPSLKSLKFRPYAPLLPVVSEIYAVLRVTEAEFVERTAGRLTKRQAALLGLLARTYQLANSVLANQLLQNHAGWYASYRALLETFFVLDWSSQNLQRLEAYFEGRAPSIGRIKSEACGRHPHFKGLYDRASEIAHVGDGALHLPRLKPGPNVQFFPFTAVSMSLAGSTLESMMLDLIDVFSRCKDLLRSSLIDNFDQLTTGEVMWDAGNTSAKFGCLSFEPKEPRERDPRQTWHTVVDNR